MTLPGPGVRGVLVLASLEVVSDLLPLRRCHRVNIE
jgi:hypothetical protein